MDSKLKSLIFISLSFFIYSCNKVEDKEPNFYNNEYRIGLWITPDKRDTLEFIDYESLVRKGHFFVHEEYLYRIDGEYLYVRLLSSPDEYGHKIMTAEQNMVTLFNMYFTTGFGDNSGTYFKNKQ
jgi:hypothetical protein